MLIYAGIDEAGYGPLMGPLCVACSHWSIDAASNPHAPPDLWKVLSRAVCKSNKDRRGRIAINDSKKLKGNGTNGVHPMRTIERGVLAALSLASTGEPITDDCDLFRRVSAVEPSTTAPWYSGSINLPWACDAAHIQIASAMLRRAALDASVIGYAMACETIDAEEINHAAQRGLVKTSVPWTLLINHVTKLRAQWSSASIRVAADRQSGRMRYLDDLLRAFPRDRICILGENERESIYQLDGVNSMVISFTVEGERNHLPIALASMTAKYVRELWMARLNRWFAERVTNLQPTAGYVTDGRRFVGLIRPALAACGLDESRLVRRI